jgi:hypothetical protein
LLRSTQPTGLTTKWCKHQKPHIPLRSIRTQQTHHQKTKLAEFCREENRLSKSPAFRCAPYGHNKPTTRKQNSQSFAGGQTPQRSHSLPQTKRSNNRAEQTCQPRTHPPHPTDATPLKPWAACFKNGVAQGNFFSRAACEHEKNFPVTGPQSFYRNRPRTPNNSSSNGASTLILSPLDGTVNSINLECKNILFNPISLIYLLNSLSPYLSSPAI